MDYLKVASKYRRRIASIPGAQKSLSEQVARDLKSGLQSVTKENLYDRTPLKVTGKMMKSIGTTISDDDSEVSVGYNIGKAKKAKHAPIRVSMTGMSVTGGHLLDMNVANSLRKKTQKYLTAAARAAQRRILRG